MIGDADVGEEEWKRSGGGNGLSLLFCAAGFCYVVPLNSALRNISSLYFSDFTRSDHWVAALSQCFYLIGQNLGKNGFFSGLAKLFAKKAI